MAIRLARRVRPLLIIAALGCAGVLAPTLASASPGTPRSQPTITSVQRQLGELALRNTQLVEQYNQSRVQVAQREKAAAAATRAAAQASRAYDRANVEFTRIIQAQYESGSLGAASALLESNSGNNYVDRLNILDLMSTHDAQVVKLVTKARSAASAQSSKASDLLAAAKSERNALSSKQTAVINQIATYKKTLATLTSAQQAAYQRAANPSVSASTLTAHLTTATPAGARKAVEFALAQVGKPYVFGAAGPSSYDCSGLTEMAWQAGGVSLPHSAADQYNYGHHVSIGALQPGDLIFMYQPIGHVTIYIGAGMMVSAPTEGENVSVVPVSAFSSDIVGATRLI